MKLLASSYGDTNAALDRRLRVGEALLQTVKRCGETLALYGMLTGDRKEIEWQTDRLH